MKEKVIIAGAGLVGSLWAILLAKRGYEVDVYESRGDMRSVDFVGGRSINLAMSDRGWRAIEKAGILENIRSVAIPMSGRMIHSVDGELAFQPYGVEDEAIYSVSRGGLNIELINIADSFDNVNFHFYQKCTGVDLKKNTVTFQDFEGQKKKLQSDLVFGVDGAFSAVRAGFQKTARFNYSQQYLEHGYKELRIPPAPNGNHLIEKNALHIWPRGQFMLIALPNLDGSFTCTLFLPFEGEESFENLKTNSQITDFFKKHFPDTIPLIPDLVEDFNKNPTGTLVTISCFPWQYNHRFLLLGDAAHAIVPFYGQGMNSGFEDCTILDDLIEIHQGHWPTIIDEFNATRVSDTNAIAELAFRNFIEMRDLVGDPKFLLRKKIEKHLSQKYPDQFLPLYSMVTFSHVSYNRALKEGRDQDQLFEKIMAIENIEDWWNSPMVDEVFKKWLENKF